MAVVFITGITGFLGRHVASRMLRRGDLDQLLCLVRCDDAEHGQARILKSLAKVIPEEQARAMAAKLRALPGDLCEEGLGLSDEDRALLVNTATSFLHCAADVRFNQDLEDARLRNVFGSEQVATLARDAHRQGQLQRFDWVGTAFVAGLRQDLVGEGDLEHEAGWKNSYEQSKYEAELLLRAEFADLPMTVFRPSVIVGESSTGATSNFGMLYWPVQLYARGWWRTVVGRPETPVDLVPVDFVADAIEYLSRNEKETGGVFHLAAGPDGTLTIAELAQLCQEYFGGRPARYISPTTFFRWVRPVVDLFIWGKKRRVIQAGGRFFIPYFNGNPLFDITTCQAALDGSGIVAPSVRNYITVLFDYCVATDFGRIPAGSNEPSPRAPGPIAA
jgi:long-chain acyl-CoA synthetase